MSEIRFRPTRVVPPRSATMVVPGETQGQHSKMLPTLSTYRMCGLAGDLMCYRPQQGLMLSRDCRMSGLACVTWMSHLADMKRGMRGWRH